MSMNVSVIEHLNSYEYSIDDWRSDIQQMGSGAM